MDDAASLYRAALEVAPTLAEPWTNYGRAVVMETRAVYSVHTWRNRGGVCRQRCSRNGVGRCTHGL